MTRQICPVCHTDHTRRSLLADLAVAAVNLACRPIDWVITRFDNRMSGDER